MGAGIELTLEGVYFLPLIPHHGLVTFSAKVAAPTTQTTRMRRTARSKLDSDTNLLPNDVEELQSEIDATLPLCEVSAAVSVIQRDLLRERRSEWRRLSQHFTTDTWRTAAAEAAVRKAKGSAGYDGWHSSELKMISTHFELLLFDLYTLWRDTCETLLEERPGVELQHLIFAWRVVGVPKKDPTQSRPIGVGSVLMRAWLTACEQSLPTPQDAQFACKAGSTVIYACCLWHHACQHGECGLERDLSKCYDNVPHAMADAALRNAKTPRRVRAVANAAWRGPRTSQVAGELAEETLWPTRSLAQGDSTARKMEADVQATDAYDSGTGSIENVGKRQCWKRGDKKQIEHIGILAVPDDPHAKIIPAGGWDKSANWNAFLEVFFEAVTFELLQHDPERGVQSRRPADEPHARVRRVCGRRRIFWNGEEMVPHLIRQACWARALARMSAERSDAEGVDQIDLEASSAPA
ncbi:unnamed protein product [Prorocentrum cordatum]|uniref:Uncharacterized protein n=1 Tax=Prorocentrum cordatum TaxID=2364126 RepID=A0ABN9WPK0_9DINO|nr:unnamed protein product [Polarella glacialis]